MRSPALLATAVATLTIGLAAPASSAADDIPGVDQIRHSWNVRDVANVPKQGPFADINALDSDLAFSGDKVIAGNYNGFVIYDIRNPRKPKVLSQVLCPGSQNDVSVYGNLLFLSTDSSRSDSSCNSTSLPASEKNAWEGMKIFDISDATAPKYVAAVETDCGSHTHTLVPGKGGKDVYLYVSSYAPNAAFPDCQPPHDFISIIKVPLKDPTMAGVVAKPVSEPGAGDVRPRPELPRKAGVGQNTRGRVDPAVAVDVPGGQMRDVRPKVRDKP
ncbi:hypothetical protein ACFQ1S_07385 [Kibdelosporangium lantanae]|uniref:LVIVD repeat-containing protein n=1 Tax=Kibdelosporangium lantanae TaxID=1497396 RepID=A0ABW3M4G1_9PSEU